MRRNTAPNVSIKRPYMKHESGYIRLTRRLKRSSLASLQRGEQLQM